MANLTDTYNNAFEALRSNVEQINAVLGRKYTGDGDQMHDACAQLADTKNPDLVAQAIEATDFAEDPTANVARLKEVVDTALSARDTIFSSEYDDAVIQGLSGLMHGHPEKAQEMARCMPEILGSRLIDGPCQPVAIEVFEKAAEINPFIVTEELQIALVVAIATFDMKRHPEDPNPFVRHDPAEKIICMRPMSPETVGKIYVAMAEIERLSPHSKFFEMANRAVLKCLRTHPLDGQPEPKPGVAGPRGTDEIA